MAEPQQNNDGFLFCRFLFWLIYAHWFICMRDIDYIRSDCAVLSQSIWIAEISSLSSHRSIWDHFKQDATGPLSILWGERCGYGQDLVVRKWEGTTSRKPSVSFQNWTITKRLLEQILIPLWQKMDIWNISKWQVNIFFWLVTVIFVIFFSPQGINIVEPSNAELPPRPPSPAMYQLDIVLKKGNNLAIRDRTGRCSVYQRSYVVTSKKRKRFCETGWIALLNLYQV